MKPAFQVPYPRPTNLSDPYYDFDGCDLKALAARPIDEMKWDDYQYLFGPHLPAGTYEEVMFFLPYAFDFLKINHNDSLDVTYAVFGFCSINKDKLQRDGLLEIVQAKILDCLQVWSQEFNITHYDKEAC